MKIFTNHRDISISDYCYYTKHMISFFGHNGRIDKSTNKMK